MEAKLAFVGICIPIAAICLSVSATATDSSGAKSDNERGALTSVRSHYSEGCSGDLDLARLSALECSPGTDVPAGDSSPSLAYKPESKNESPNQTFRSSPPAGINEQIYRKNNLEFSLEGAWLPINIPFPLDVFEGDPYKLYPLRYTLVPIIASLRWHFSDIKGPMFLRGNWDLTSSASYTQIPKGPETRYYSYIMGIRRNFVPRSLRVAPYWDLRLGLGNIDARGGSHGILYAQGEDFTFTAQMGSGVRYNFNPRIGISGGLNYMHLSNAGLSGRKTNFGINVYGPMFGIVVQLRRPQEPAIH
jgi:Lipid A 3-O-deacylase (PagL)